MQTSKAAAYVFCSITIQLKKLIDCELRDFGMRPKNAGNEQVLTKISI